MSVCFNTNHSVINIYVKISCSRSLQERNCSPVWVGVGHQSHWRVASVALLKLSCTNKGFSEENPESLSFDVNKVLQCNDTVQVEAVKVLEASAKRISLKCSKPAVC